MGGMKEINNNRTPKQTLKKKTVLYHCLSIINPLKKNSQVNEREWMRSILCVSEGENTDIMMK